MKKILTIALGLTLVASLACAQTTDPKKITKTTSPKANVAVTTTATTGGAGAILGGLLLIAALGGGGGGSSSSSSSSSSLSE